VSKEPTTRYYQISWNTKFPPLNNVKVRQAISMSVDRKVLADAILGPGNSGGPALMPLPPESWAYTKKLENSVKYDPARAKKLLAEAGFPNGITLKLCATNSVLGYGSDITDIEREQMKPAGITLDVEFRQGSACNRAFNVEKNLMAYQVGFSGRPDPYLTFEGNFSSTGLFNTSKEKYPGVDEVLAKIAKTYDRKAQKPLYDELNRLWIQQVPKLALFYAPNYAIYTKDLVGEQPNLMGKINPTTWYFQK
jgi:ABC-type transport system substrate-binding protein